MPVPGSILDGSPGYGSRLLTFSTAGAYLAENISISRPFSEATDLKTTGEPNRSRYTQGKATMTATLQAPSGASGWPQAGETFTATFDSNYGAETYVVMWVPYEETNDPGSLRKINIEARKVINSITTVAASAT